MCTLVLTRTNCYRQDTARLKKGSAQELRSTGLGWLKPTFYAVAKRLESDQLAVCIEILTKKRLSTVGSKSELWGVQLRSTNDLDDTLRAAMSDRLSRYKITLEQYEKEFWVRSPARPPHAARAYMYLLTAGWGPS
jgi:hypothetical protein